MPAFFSKEVSEEFEFFAFPDGIPLLSRGRSFKKNILVKTFLTMLAVFKGTQKSNFSDNGFGLESLTTKD